MTAPVSSEPLWFAGVCDSLYNKVVQWRDNYERGDVSRTRQKLNEQAQVVDVPVQYAMRIPWHQRELDYLVRILKATGAQASLVEDIEKVQAGLRTAPALAGGLRVVTMVFWKDDLVEMLRCLDKAKGATNAIEDYLRSQAGKPGLFRL
jgi:hypothetical protein